MATTKKAAAKAEKETKKTTKTATKAAAKAAEATEEKAAPAKKTAAKKAPAKKAAPKKTDAKKTAEANVDFFVEFGGVQVSVADVVANVKATYGKDAKEIAVYLKPEESKAYFVADGEESEMDVFFC
ncbi:MAG: DUF6465 family protein [Ruminococcus sp.]|nr:DUF6465 family protein [Ruminococcus sp.]